jgi:hypothetical protein
LCSHRTQLCRPFKFPVLLFVRELLNCFCFDQQQLKITIKKVTFAVWSSAISALLLDHSSCWVPMNVFFSLADYPVIQISFPRISRLESPFRAARTRPGPACSACPYPENLLCRVPGVTATAAAAASNSAPPTSGACHRGSLSG